MSGDGRAPGLRRGAAVTVAACALVTALAALSGGDAGRKSLYPSKFADGDGRALTEQMCTVCHSAMLVTQQRKDSTAWEKSVRTMEAWGAPVPPEQHAAIVSYLTAHYGPVAKR